MTADERRARAGERKAALEARRRELQVARELRLRVESIISERRLEALRVRAETMSVRRSPQARSIYNRMAQWAREYPERRRAHRLVHSALQSGRIEKPGRCDGCGLDRRLEAHHEDYAKPLGVRWLCRSCHRLAHRALAAGGAA